MSGAPRVEFFYSLGSRYSYLASTQLEKLAAETGCVIDWHPVRNAALMEKIGPNPFRGAPVSGQYDWSFRQADAEAWAAHYGVPYREPVQFRKDPQLLSLAAIAAKRLGAVEAYSRCLSRAIFVEGRVIERADCLDCADRCDLNRERFTALLDDPETQEIHDRTIDRAHQKGAFGVPTFFVGERMFWGNDRLPLVRFFLGQGAVSIRP